MTHKYQKINPEDPEKDPTAQANKNIFINSHFNIRKTRLRTLGTYRNITVIVIVLIWCNLLLSSRRQQLPTFNFSFFNYSNSTEKSVSSRYLINTPQCKIPDFDPFAKDVMAIYSPIEYEPCSEKPSLTYIEKIWSNDTVMLHLELSAVENYTTDKDDKLECCYQGIIRDSNYEHSDGHKILSTCHSFDTAVQLPAEAEFILVKCTLKSSNSSENEQVYINAHAMVRRKPEVLLRLKAHAHKNTPKPLNVLLIGIDSMSRLNLLRTMPNTAKHLHETGWLELRGYNKIGYNTCPNLMAILAGFNESMSDPLLCGGELKEFFNIYPLIWNNFKEHGYVTAYAEDMPSMDTFNYVKRGFLSQPVDHYFRPFVLAAEEFLKTQASCLGYQKYADYIYQYAIDLVQQYDGHPYFGLFWTNSFSHDDFRTPSAMDDKMQEYFVQLNETGILNETFVVFFSDHGPRYGGIRSVLSGWFEERLPFIFFLLPDWFKKANPDFVKNLEINQNRLTSHHDLHVTLKHVLSLSSDQTYDDPFGQSLFEEVPFDRSCTDAHISQEWCTCIPYESFNKSSSEVENASIFAMQEINNELQGHPNCSELELNTIFDAEIANLADNVTYYRVTFDAVPSEAKFEATVKRINETNYELIGSISRLNMYGHQGDCIDDAHLRIYCFCVE